ENAEYLVGDLFVARHAWPDANRVRAKTEGNAHWHRRVHAVFTDFVAGGRYDSTACCSPDNEGLSDEAGIVALFDGRVESVHVDVENSACHRNWASEMTQRRDAITG